MAIDLLDAARAIAEAQTHGHEIVTVTVLTGEHAGARYLSRTPGTIDGSLAPELDARAAEAAAQCWAQRATVFGGDLFAELHLPAEPLLIFGAGHIAVPLANMAVALGFSVTVLDDREEMVDAARFAEGVGVRPLDFSDPLKDVTLTSRTYVVLVTRAHKYDFDCLRTVLQQPEQPRYIGMIGSKRRVRAAFQALIDHGVSRESLAQVHAPVGLDIGAETPAEIAVSIAAELIQVRRGATGNSKQQNDRILERMFPAASAS